MSTPAHKQDGGSKMIFAMVTIGVVCAAMIVFTYETTLPVIKVKKEAALNRAIFQVLPGINRTEAFQLKGDSLQPLDANDAEAERVYVGYDEQGTKVGYALMASGQGYADIIKVLYGYSTLKEQIIGFYVLETKETPGLGDKIEKDADFLANFKALDVAVAADSLKHPVYTVKHGTKEEAWEIDAITGATISSRAVGDMMNASTKRLIPILHHIDKKNQSERRE